MLTELIERHTEWKSRGANRGGAIVRDHLRATEVSESSIASGTMMSEWQFDTMRSRMSAVDLDDGDDDVEDESELDVWKASGRGPPEEGEDRAGYGTVRKGLRPVQDLMGVMESKTPSATSSRSSKAETKSLYVDKSNNSSKASLGATSSGGEAESTPATSTASGPTTPKTKETDVNGSIHVRALRNTLGDSGNSLAPPKSTSPGKSQVSNGSVTSTSTSATDRNGKPRRSSWNERNDINGTILKAGDIATGMDTIRPVKRLDKGGSARISKDFIGTNGRSHDGLGLDLGSTRPRHAKKASSGSIEDDIEEDEGGSGQAGRALVRDVVLPVLERAKHDNMEAREIEALEMISKGFGDLSQVNSKLAYSTIVDLLLSMNENEQARDNLSTTFRERLSPEMRRKREQAEKEQADSEASAAYRSPIADLLYGRWMEGLRSRWNVLA